MDHHFKEKKLSFNKEFFRYLLMVQIALKSKIQIASIQTSYKTLKSRYSLLFGFFCLIFFTIFVSFTLLSQESLRLDEAQSLWQTSRPPSDILNVVGQDVHVPFYHLLLHFWRVAVGEGVEAARSLSLVFFIFCVLAVYKLSRTVYSQSEAFFAATLIAFSPFMNWYGNEARMYTMLAFFTIINQYFFIRIQQRQGRSWINWFMYAFVSFMGLYTHYFFGMVLLTQAVFFFFYAKYFPKKSLIKFVGIAFFLAAALSPWLIYVKHLGLAKNTQPSLLAPTATDLFNVVAQLMYGFHVDSYQAIILSLWPVVVILAFMTLRKSEKISPETAFFFFSIFFPIIFTYFLSYVVKPVYLSRYLIVVLPAITVFLGHMFSLYSPFVSRTLQTATLIVFIFFLGQEIEDRNVPVKEGYNEATEILNAEMRPQDVIFLSAPFTIYPVEYYYRGPTPLQTFPEWNRFDFGPIPPFSEAVFIEKVNELKKTRGTIWILLSYNQGYEETIVSYMRNNFELLQDRRFSIGIRLLQYKFRYYEPETMTVIDDYKKMKLRNAKLKKIDSKTIRKRPLPTKLLN